MERKTVTANPKFWAMLQSAQRQRGNQDLLHIPFIALDPGETTGFAYRLPWEEGFKVHLMQLETKDIPNGLAEIEKAWPTDFKPQRAIVEDYKVYGWKADSHKWAGLHTPKLIGAIEYFMHLRGIPIVYQMAVEAKRWADDAKLKLWDMYEPGMKHARDAERHILTQIFFGQL